MIMDLESQSLPTQQFVPPEMRPETSTTASNQLAHELGSFISFSCRTRAENFARKLQLKLKTLGSFDTVEDSGNNSTEDKSTTWKSISLDSHLNGGSSKRNFIRDGNSNINRTLLPEPMKDSTMKCESRSEETTAAKENQMNVNGTTNGHSTSTDSDRFYDFDIASPGSPVENGADSNCYAVINPCDDLYCEDCTLPNKKKSCPKISRGTRDSTESGCIFSSPASTSPDGHQNPNAAPDMDNSFYHIQHSFSGDDCTSDASDSSIYYDVESNSPGVPASPKSEAETTVGQEIPQNYTAKVELHIISSSPKPSSFELSPLTITLPPIEAPFSSIHDEKLLSPDFGIKSYHNHSGSTNNKNSQEATEDDSDSSDSDKDRPRLQRCSSLKTGKTPPGTPGRKKIVRFADVLGLDLADVRTFLDEIPKIPKSAYRDLDYPLDSFSLSSHISPSSTAFGSRGPSTNNSASDTNTVQLSKLLVPTFHQPVSRPDFFDRIRDHKVLLENAFLSDHFTIKGAVRVMNLDFHKSVYIRYTLDEWKTFTDFQATYVNGSCDGFSDKFEFSIKLNPDLIEMGSRVIMAARFHCKGEQFWDSNYGQNYLFHCVPGSSPNQPLLHGFDHQHSSHSHHVYSSSPEDPWISHMWL